MNTKVLLLSLTALLFSTFIFSQTVTEKQAKKVAKNFFYEKININKKVKYDDIKLNLKETLKKDNLVIFRVYEPVNQSGFILISGNESTIPIIGYSTKNTYIINQELPPNFKEWIDGYAIQIEDANKQNLDFKNPQWDVYSKIPDLKNIKSAKNVAPLLSTTWNQGCGYNSLCPETSSGGQCGHVWAGCVATAMAQVMKYHNHPVNGEDTFSYIHHTYGYQFADFGNTTYNWGSMPDNSGNADVAELIYHCGVSVSMNYSPSGSGAYSWRAASSLKSFFKYSSNLLLTYKGNYTDENWAKLLKIELDEGRPMYYQGSGSGGHAFNIDGYQGTNHFHLNWGWGGSYNGYYYLNDLTPGSHSYNDGQAAIIGAIDRATYSGIDCSSAVNLTAGVPYNGTTTNSQNIVNKYGNSFYHSTGKEVVHQIITSFPGRIRASLTNLNDSVLDVFILSHCMQDSLLAYGDTTAFVDDTEPGTYYIMVDGRYAYEGDYTLTVISPTNDADLIITNQAVVPNKIEAGGLGMISFKIKNIGNSSALASKTNIYYSEDEVFDGSDILINQINISELNSGSEQSINQSITIPAVATEGMRYILFIADAENVVVETDEIYNTEISGFEVPAAGIMDCSSSISLINNVWHYGNTETDGDTNIENYPCWWEALTGKEIIHSITATHTGVASFSFTEKIPGNLKLFALTACNENTCENSFAIWNPLDTVMQESIQVFAGITYYFVVDAEEGISGEYGLKVKMPGVCPEPYIKVWGDTDICESNNASVNIETSWLYSGIQWYKDNVPIVDETSSWIGAKQTGVYKVEVTENGCSGFSEEVEVHISPLPSNADITASGDTVFCEGNNVTLNLNTGTGYTVQWMKNGNPIIGETGMSFIAEETGIYTAEVTNIGCSINSNTKQIIANPVTADIGEFARVNSNAFVSWFSCDMYDNADLSGNGNDYFGSWVFPEDRNGNWNKAQYYNGQWDSGTTTNSFDNPNIFTLSIWIKTNTNTGGMIIGLGDTQSGASTISDRMIYMDDTGKLYFGLMDGTAKTVSTTESYNDNTWHLLNASLSGSGMKLYVDGQLKAEDATVTNGANYTGWWKIAYDNIDSSFPNIPTNLYYRGVVDEIKIYERELLAGEILYLYEENNIFNALIDNNSFCETGTANIVLTNTENFIEYQLRNDADNSLIGSAITGNTEIINLPTGSLSETTTFNVLATNPLTGCSFELNDLFTVFKNDLPTATISGNATICEDETTNLSVNLTGTAPWDITYTDGTNSFNETISDNPYVFTVSDAGTYQITAVSDNNCTGTSFSGTATVVVNNLPDVDLGEDVNITITESVTLDAGAGYTAYLWSDASTEQTLNLQASDLGVGNFEYSVLVEDANTCENSDTIIVNVTQGTFIESFSNSEISIYPNPTKGVFIIDFNEAFKNKLASLTISDINGKIIYSSQLFENTKTIDLSKMGEGVYFIEISVERKIYRTKILIY